MDTPSLSLDDFGPLPVRTPASAAELGELVREAAAAGQGLYPVGGRTTLDLGLPPLKPGFAVDTRGLSRVIDYPARDMTITVEAGITMAELGRTLAAEKQWLPIDVPLPKRATLGGAVAVNASGPHRLGYGTLRDYVIGISFVADDGGEVKAGGRVVKNVAGYDLMKLQVGALGTLGVITQVTLKVKPRPEAAATVTLDCQRDALASVLDLLQATKSRPAIADLATRGAGWRITAAFEEKAATVEWQVATLLADLKAAAVTDARAHVGTPAAAVLAELRDPAESAASFIWKANVLPSRTAAFCNTAMDCGPRTALQAHGLNGIVYGCVAEELSLANAATMVERLTTLAVEGGGNLTIRRCPFAWKKSLPVWGRPGPDRDLMRHVKKTLDPKNVFNPGRLFGDL